MKIAIMQPTYLPWMGYFDLMHQVDTFVILDNVAFSKQSFHQRNRIKTPQGFLWLTVPVKNQMGQLLMHTELANTLFLKKHLKSIATAYQKAPFYKAFYPKIETLYQSFENESHLININLSLISFIKEALGITTPFVFASALENINQSRGARLIDIAKALKTTTYITPPGAVDYLKDDMHHFEKAGIDVAVHTFEHPSYNQLYLPFISHLSALDLLMNEGHNGFSVLTQGSRPATPFEAFNHTEKGFQHAKTATTKL